MAALLLLVALPYLAGLRHDFVYDDHGVIVENQYLQDTAHVGDVLSLSVLRNPRVLDGQRPVVILSYFLDRAVWGLEPFGYHLTNLLLHLAAVLSLFLLLRLLHSSILPFFASLLFGLHPVLTEAVQCPAFREDLLLGLFGLLYLAAAFARGPVTPVVLQALALALALGSKESAVMLPALLVWLWLCVPSARPAPRTAIAMLSVALTLVAAFTMNSFTGRPLQAAGGAWNGLSLQFPSNLLTAPGLFHEYVRLLIWPIPLCVDRIIAPVFQLSEFRFVKGALTLVLWASISLALVRRAPMVALGMGWMLILFVPVSNIVPLFNPMAERYLYFMVPGFALVAVSLLLRVKAFQVLLPAITAVYIALIMLRLADWRNDETLWTATLKAEPMSARANTWLGFGAKYRGDLQKAANYFERAAELNPHDTIGLINLGVMYGQTGDYVTAERLLREAARLRPDKADAHWNLALALTAQGRAAEAGAEFRATLKADPSHPQASEMKRMIKGK
ncbi:MAG TPA: tetratricopeptide repeat protein [Kiritimatiellia bacterium]